MEVDMIEDKENPLLNRREIRFKVSYQGPTPARQDVRSKIIAMLNLDKELTLLDKLDPQQGSQVALGYLKSYGDKAAMSIEPEYLLKRNFEVKEEPKEDGGSPPSGDDGGSPDGEGESGGDKAAAEGGDAKSEKSGAGKPDEKAEKDDEKGEDKAKAGSEDETGPKEGE
ncbi:MAG: hypothetical protein GF416_01310 [Candidatus Altiarchaeales archaeon]|nr:hypothetical protein [Candidatus Altiarchaeales archaeon]MBD3415754.1 hypothetical protein [Candidatus Altiarchaeales archaeon]